MTRPRRGISLVSVLIALSIALLFLSNRVLNPALVLVEVVLNAHVIWTNRRALPDVNSQNKNMREAAERMAFNTVLQGTAAEIIKLAMIRLRARLARELPRARLILQVHDELLFEAPAVEL